MSGRGRKRRCGPSGGGTLRRKSPQEGQRPSIPRGLAVSARSQWPRASQSGLMHCTVRPGRYCICFSPRGREAQANGAVATHGPAQRKSVRAPWPPPYFPRYPKPKRCAREPAAGVTDRGRAGTALAMAGIVPGTIVGVKKKGPQDIVVRLHLWISRFWSRALRDQSRGNSCALNY